MMPKRSAATVMGVLLAAGGVLGVSQAAGNDIAYDNLGTNNDFVFIPGLVANGSASSVSWASFFDFTAEASGGILTIELPIEHNRDPQDYIVSIKADAGGQPGAVVGEWPASGDTNIANLPEMIRTDGTIELVENTTYWFGVKAGSPTTDGVWGTNTMDDIGSVRWALRNNEWRSYGSMPKGAFRITVESELGCIADWNGDGEVDINDFFAYLSDFEAGDPRADLNNDGEIDINDFFIFLQEFEAGC